MLRRDYREPGRVILRTTNVTGRLTTGKQTPKNIMPQQCEVRDRAIVTFV
jgi:hypothetical protein